MHLWKISKSKHGKLSGFYAFPIKNLGKHHFQVNLTFLFFFFQFCCFLVHVQNNCAFLQPRKPRAQPSEEEKWKKKIKKYKDLQGIPKEKLKGDHFSFFLALSLTGILYSTPTAWKGVFRILGVFWDVWPKWRRSDHVRRNGYSNERTWTQSNKKRSGRNVGNRHLER